MKFYINGAINIMRYLYETHSHTKPVSICGQITPIDFVDWHINEEISGAVLTNHFNQDTFESAGLKDASTEAWADYFLEDYRIAKKAAKGKDFTVLLGMEIRFSESMNEFLIYGMDESFFYHYANNKLLELGIEDFRKIADSNNFLVYQAHPFRKENYLVDVNLLDGIEVLNGHKRVDSKNHLALQSAYEANMKKIAGSDVHRAEDIGSSGLLSKTRIKTMDQFVSAINADPQFFF